MHINSVNELREHALQQSRRPFLARGSKVNRCSVCLMAQIHCLCAHVVSRPCEAAVCCLFYQGEVFKPSNTGRLIADVVPDNHAFLWHRTEHDPALLALIANPSYQPIVVFPHQYVEPERAIHAIEPLGEGAQKRPLFIFLDGTWREAKKMFRSPYLAHLPVLGIQPEQASLYLLREAAHLHQLCTAEVAIDVLHGCGESQAATSLAQHFYRFRRAYLAAKANIRQPLPPCDGDQTIRLGDPE